MKITDVRILRLALPTDTWEMVAIETDDHITGWGEVSDSFLVGGLVHVLETAKSLLVGKNPLEMVSCMQPFRAWRYPVLEDVRPYAVAVSGIDQALWDITAKHYGVPLYKLYGADGVVSVPLYANLNKGLRRERQPEVLAERAYEARKAGFQMVKCTPFDEVNRDKADVDLDPAFARLHAIGTAVPFDTVAIDCHQRFDRQRLGVMVRRMMDAFGAPYWLEDPVPVFDYDAVAQIANKYPEIRWAAGEDSMGLSQILRTMQSKQYEILMPDVKFIGGPSAIKGLIPVAVASGNRVTMHNPSGIIATAHSAHLTALCGDGIPMEFPFEAVPERSQLLSLPEHIEHGSYVFSDKPGIGVEIAPEAWREFGYWYGKGEWQRLDGGC